LKKLYTVGHSVYDMETFISLLKKHQINSIVDVRSIPYSKFASQYNKEALKVSLHQNNINYIFMGDLLGAKQNNKALLFDNGKVDFKKVQETTFFQRGIKRLEQGIEKGYTISLMCAEKEALECHRFALISEYISKNLANVEVEHIYPNKVISQKELEERLVKKYHKQIDYLNLNTNKSPLEQGYFLHA